MKKLLLSLLSICIIASCYAITANSTIEKHTITTQDITYVKNVQLYSIVNGTLQKSGIAELYKQRYGYGYRYFIQLKNTTIQLLVQGRSYNTPQGFNSWSVDGWGYYYYYNI